MRAIGVILIILGILGFAFGGFSFTRREKVADIGPLDVTKTERERVPIAPIASGIAVVAGLALVFAGNRGRSIT
jgi:hypothetical protein